MAEGGNTSTQMCDICDSRGGTVEAVHSCIECKRHLCQQCRNGHGINVCKYNTICGLCSKEGLHFCINCEILLCSRCLRSHKLNPKFQAHQITIMTGCNKKMTFKFEACPNHPKTTIQFYCQLHDAVFCASCRNTKHRTCDHVTTTREAARASNLGERFRRATDETDVLLERVKTASAKRQDDQKKLLNHKVEELQRVLDRLRTLRENLIQLVNDLEREIPDRMNECFNLEHKLLSESLQSLDEYKTRLEDDAIFLQQAEETGDREYMFIAMKQIKPRRWEGTLESREATLKVECVDIIQDSLRKLKLTDYFTDTDSPSDH